MITNYLIDQIPNASHLNVIYFKTSSKGVLGQLHFYMELCYVNQKNSNERFNIPGKDKSGNTHINY